jgi:uncharacterized protein YlxW (UPF0749 family)
MATEADELSKTNWLTIVGMAVALIVFGFSTFQTRADSERQDRDQTQRVNEVNHNFEELRYELHETRKELNSKLDALLEKKGIERAHQ